MTVFTELQNFSLKVFWKEMIILLLGTIIFSYSAGNVDKKLSTLTTMGIIIGLTIFIFGLILMFKHSDKIRK